MFEALTDKEIETLRDKLNGAWEATLHDEDTGVWLWINDIDHDLLREQWSRKAYRSLGRSYVRGVLGA